jgi:hypothetical protein
VFIFFLKQFFKQLSLEVYSERNILKEVSKKSMRPDISIWKDNHLIAVIELKVSDGWKRAGMLDHLDKVKAQIQAGTNGISTLDSDSSLQENLINNDIPSILEEANHLAYEGFLEERRRLMANKLKVYYEQL